MSEQGYLVDATSLIKHPELLAFGRVDMKFIIPSVVMSEIIDVAKQSDFGLNMVSTVNESISKHHAYISELKQDFKRVNGLTISHGGLERSYIKNYIIELSKQLSSNKIDIIVITEDKDLGVNLSRLGIKSINGSKFIGNKKWKYGPEKDLNDKIRSIKRRHLLGNILSILAFVFSAGIAIYINTIAPYIFNKINVLLTALYIVVISTSFYYFRQKLRFQYGLAEFTFGLFTTLRIIYGKPITNTIDISLGIQVMACIYVMVRGLDNVSKGFMGRRYYVHWKNIFGAPT